MNPEVLTPLLDWLDYNGFHIITKKAKTFTDRDGRTRIKGDMDIEIAVKSSASPFWFTHIRGSWL